MSDLIDTLPINHKELPTQDEYNILDTYFPNTQKIDIYNIKLSFLISFLSIIIIITKELYFTNISLNIYIPLSFIIIFILSFTFITLF